MLHKIAVYLVARLQGLGYIKADNSEWCVYILENRFFSYLCFLAFFLLGSLVFPPLGVLAFLGCLMLIRRNAGGYHCTTTGRCLLLSVLAVCLGLFAARALVPHATAQLLLLLVSTLALVRAPVNQAALHLSRQELAGNRKRLRTIQLVMLPALGILCLFHSSFSAYGTVGYAAAALSVLAANILYRRELL